MSISVRRKRNRHAKWRESLGGVLFRWFRYVIQLGRCKRCSTMMLPPIKSLNKKYHGTDVVATLDHIKPLCEDGDNRLSNLRLICSKCNNERPKYKWSPFYNVAVKMKMD